MKRIYNDPAAPLPETPGELFRQLREAGDRIAQAKAYRAVKQTRVGVRMVPSRSEIMQSLGIRNWSIFYRNCIPNSARRMARIGARVVAMCGRQTWPEEWDDLQELCNGRERQDFELEVRGGEICWRNGPKLRTYTDKERKLYAKAYAEMSEGIDHGDADIALRKQVWRNSKEPRLRKAFTAWEEQVDPAMAAKFLDCEKLYFVANGFTWGEIWGRIAGMELKGA